MERPSSLRRRCLPAIRGSAPSPPMNSWKEQILSVPSSAVDLGWVILLAVACLPGTLPAADAPPGLKQAAAHQPKPGGTFTNTIAMRFAYIPPGEFTMGSPKTETGRSGDETQHQVTLTKGWHLGIHPVTQAQWKAVMGGDSASRFKADDLPVDEVLWNDAVTFCKKLSEKEGRRYRLPTSAEWEYACRAGTATAFNTGDDEAALNEAGWVRRQQRLQIPSRRPEETQRLGPLRHARQRLAVVQR